MRKNLLMAISLAICVMLPAALFAGGNPTTCGTTNVVSNPILAINNKLPDGTTDTAIRSDGGTYQTSTSKRDKLTIEFQISNCSYDFTMNLAQTSPVRNIIVSNLPTDAFPTGATTSAGFNFDRLGSVPITDTNNPASAYQSWCSLENMVGQDGVIKGWYGPSGAKMPYDNYMPCDVDSEGKNFARRSVAFGLANDYSLFFQNDLHHTPFANGTCPVKVYHPDQYTWRIVPDDMTYTYFDPFTGKPVPPAPIPPLPLGSMWSVLVHAVSSRSPSIVGYYNMPFYFEITTH